MSVNFAKLKAAIHYICEKASPQPEKLDDIKLNKVLWYSDCMAYLARNVSITGTKYMKKPRGPVAKYNRMALEELERDGALKRGKMSNDGRWPTSYDVIQDANKALFDGEELAIIDSVYKYVVLENTSNDISDQSHGEVWKMARDGDDLPLFTVFAEGRGKVREEHFRAAAVDLA